MMSRRPYICLENPTQGTAIGRTPNVLEAEKGTSNVALQHFPFLTCRICVTSIVGQDVWFLKHTQHVYAV